MVNKNPQNLDPVEARALTVDNDATKESLIGTERPGRPSNVSWGSIIAGVMTFLAVTVLLSLVTAGIGLGGSGVGAGIWSIVALAIALAAAGFVSGALAVRGGLLHGFLTWATSLVVALALTVLLGVGVLGAVGSVVDSATQAVSGTDASQVVEDTKNNVNQDKVKEQADKAAKNAQNTAKDVADTVQSSSWWVFVGLLIGAFIAAAGGMFGVRSVVNRDRVNPAVTGRTTG